jgi:hypothetical protein
MCSSSGLMETSCGANSKLAPSGWVAHTYFQRAEDQTLTLYRRLRSAHYVDADARSGGLHAMVIGLAQQCRSACQMAAAAVWDQGVAALLADGDP